MAGTEQHTGAQPRRSDVADGARLAVGTLTVLRVRAPRVDRDTASWAMTFAPLVGLLLAVLALLLMWLLGWSPSGRPPALYDALAYLNIAYLRPADPTVVALLVVALVAVLTRALHLDGLADTADGLGSGRPAEEALAVMRRGDIGPFGVVTLVLVLGLQVAALSALLANGLGPVAVAVALVVSRLVLPLACSRGVPAARADGLGRAVAGTVSRARLALAGLLAAASVVAVLVVVRGAYLPAPRSLVLGLLVVAVGLAAGGGLCWWCVRRLGGVTGDVLGACVEVGFTAVLVVLSVF